MSGRFAVASPLPAAPPAAYHMDTSRSDHKCHDAEHGCRDTLCILAFEDVISILRMIPSETCTPAAYHMDTSRLDQSGDTMCILAVERATSTLRMLPSEGLNKSKCTHTIKHCTCTTHSADAHNAFTTSKLVFVSALACMPLVYACVYVYMVSIVCLFLVYL